MSLTARGVRLIPDGDGLIAEPASKLTEEDRRAIRANKPGLLALLNGVPAQHEEERIAHLDALRKERDRVAHRGYDHASHELTESQEGGAPRSVDPEIVAELQRIEKQALELGWPRERLWNAGFWYPWPRGLVAVMEPGDHVVEVASDHITIERQRATAEPLLLRFWKADGQQNRNATGTALLKPHPR